MSRFPLALQLEAYNHRFFRAILNGCNSVVMIAKTWGILSASHVVLSRTSSFRVLD